MDDILHVTVAVPTSKLGAMYAMLGALLGSGSVGALAISATAPKADAAKPVIAPASDGSEIVAPEKPASDGTGPSAAIDASPSSEVDAGGHPWSADLHASTKGTTKEGYWRMKVGVSRPANLPGFPKDGGTGTANDGAASTQAGTVASGDAGPATSAVEDEDEFAAFRAAADKSAGTDAAAAAGVPARKWTDADLGALCNQAAVKFGDPAPVKALIQEFVPADAVPHSRNIPENKREAFAQAVEAKAEITFAG